MDLEEAVETAAMMYHLREKSTVWLAARVAQAE